MLVEMWGEDKKSPEKFPQFYPPFQVSNGKSTIGL